MKNLIFFAVLILAVGCQAPKDRSGDAAKPPTANPNATDPKVNTQVEPRVIVLTQEELKVTGTKDTDKINKMEKDNLAEQSIEKKFTFDNATATAVALQLKANSVITKSECVSEKTPVLTLKLVFDQNDERARSTPLDPQLGANLLVKAATSLELTVTVTNPGQCKNLSYAFVVSRLRD